MAPRPCQRCGIEYTPTGGGQKYCSDCIPLATAERLQRRRVPLPSVTCDKCGVEFTPYRRGQKRCSDECRAVHKVDYEKADRPRVKRDDQMESLFRYYKERSDISIEGLAEGTRIAVISDLQIPFEDLAFSAARDNFLREWKPNVVVYGGNIVDAYELSVFDKRPQRLWNLEDEFEIARKMLIRHRGYDAKLYWIDGNHEERLQRIIWNRAQEFSFLVKDIPEALRLGELCEGYVPYGKCVDIHGFVITHGTRVSRHSAYTAKQMFEQYHSSGASGHTHRAGEFSVSDARGVSHTWYELGCGCRKDMEYAKSPPNWQHAFMVGVIRNGAFHPQLVRVIEGKGGRGFVVNGEYYRIKDD